MQLPRPRTALGRAVMPVLAGIAVFALLGLATWIAAVFLSRNPERVSDRLAVTTLEVGRVEAVADQIADHGPIIFPDLMRAGGLRTVVLDHTGADPREGWQVYYAYPADRDVDCKVKQVKHTRHFTDCDHRTIEVEQLTPPPGVHPQVGDTITIDLRDAVRQAQSETDPSSPTST